MERGERGEERIKERGGRKEERREKRGEEKRMKDYQFDSGVGPT
tara:strand:+ start:197 stop:328 length:132 start_codon:yes stop_codon:yes gene_type:complete